MNSNVTGEQKSLKTTPNHGSMRLELPLQTLQRLLASGQLCPADFRCLDCATKHCVWQLVARHCAHNLGCEGRCAECNLAVQNPTHAERFPAGVGGISTIPGRYAGSSIKRNEHDRHE